MIKKILLSLSMVSILLSCDTYLDINDDPNSPLDVNIELLLPSTQVDMISALSFSTSGISALGAYYTHHVVQRSPQTGFYINDGTIFELGQAWNTVYTRALPDWDIMITKGTDEEAWHHVAIAQVLKAYTFGIMVDYFGDLPFETAGQGAEFSNPEYEDGAVVYGLLQTMLDEAIVNLSKSTEKPVGGEDLMYGGNIDSWRKTAKSVKLKLYNNVRLVQNVSAEVNQLLTEGDLLGPGDNFEMMHGTSAAPENRNLGYAQEYTGAPAWYVSPYFFEVLSGIDTFNHGNDIYSGISDPRIPYYFYNQLGDGASDSDAENPCAYCPSRSGTGFLSIFFNSFNIDPNEGFDQSNSQTLMGAYPIGGKYDDGAGGSVSPTDGAPNAPQRLLTYFDLKFIEAELILSGIISGDAAAAFQEGVEASFAEVNRMADMVGAPSISDADIASYVGDVTTRFNAANNERQLEHVITQKWIAAFGFGADIYTDHRRTGYPVLHDAETDNLAVTNSPVGYPNSVSWPQNNLDLNSSAPAQKRTDTEEAKVFWDN